MPESIASGVRLFIQAGVLKASSGAITSDACFVCIGRPFPVRAIATLACRVLLPATHSKRCFTVGTDTQ
jgi:hypothetical protein